MLDGSGYYKETHLGDFTAQFEYNPFSNYYMDCGYVIAASGNGIDYNYYVKID